FTLLLASPASYCDSDSASTPNQTLSLHDALPIYVRSSLMAVNIHITIIELNALHTKRQNLFQELDAVIHLLMEAILSFRMQGVEDRKSGSAGMPRPISYAVFCLKKKTRRPAGRNQ